MDSRHTFEKEERISLQKEIDFLFAEGKSFSVFPLRFVYAEKKAPSGTGVSILISVPKKKFKQAVKRNRLKRLIRENYRLNKSLLSECLKEQNKGLLIAVLFTGNELSSFREIETALVKALNQLKEKLQ
ncbi:MAG: ribonuclease P protein component [Candidatus Symbiothrix sp.]|nr:ribonuclease P protein component [Candidatus Symbiothrix sp.]